MNNLAATFLGDDFTGLGRAVPASAFIWRGTCLEYICDVHYGTSFIYRIRLLTLLARVSLFRRLLLLRDRGGGCQNQIRRTNPTAPPPARFVKVSQKPHSEKTTYQD